MSTVEVLKKLEICQTLEAATTVHSSNDDLNVSLSQESKFCLCHGFQQPRLQMTCQIGKEENTHVPNRA